MRADLLRALPLPGRRTLALVLVSAAAGGGIAAAATAKQAEGDGAPARAVADLADARMVSCPTALSSPRRDTAVLNRVFVIEDSNSQRYLLGWTLMPYTGRGAYPLGESGNLLALQPELGGAPVGYGTGRVVMDDDESGTLEGVIDLRSGGELALTGRWSCRGEK